MLRLSRPNPVRDASNSTLNSDSESLKDKIYFGFKAIRIRKTLKTQQTILAL